MTNLDMFRTKSAKEISQYLSCSCDCPNGRKFPDSCPEFCSCRECWEEWLNEEVEVE